MKQAHIFISGSVQAVGFRYFVKSWAKTFGLTGWVRNTEDGKVEAVFQGEKSTIEKLIEKCREGPFLAEVKRLDAEWEEVREKFIGFQIK